MAVCCWHGGCDCFKAVPPPIDASVYSPAKLEAGEHVAYVSGRYVDHGVIQQVYGDTVSVIPDRFAGLSGAESGAWSHLVAKRNVLGLQPGGK